MSGKHEWVGILKLSGNELYEFARLEECENCLEKRLVLVYIDGAGRKKVEGYALQPYASSDIAENCSQSGGTK